MVQLRAPSGFLPKGKTAALKALEIDPNLAEPHTAMGFISLLYDWDTETAENTFPACFGAESEICARPSLVL